MPSIGPSRRISPSGLAYDRSLVGEGPNRRMASHLTLALDQRRATLVDLALATRQPGGGIDAPNLLSRLQRREVERVAADLAKSTGLTYEPSRRYQDISGRFAMLADGANDGPVAGHGR